MFIGDWGTFVHIPKCAGMSVRRALMREYGQGKSVYHFHGYLDEIQDGFATVRHPAEWLRSYWAYRLYFKWIPQMNAQPYWPAIMAMLSVADGLDWHSFVTKVCKDIPGVVGRVYGLYTHPRIKFLRLEYDDLSEHLGRKMKLDSLHETPNKPKMLPDLLEMICAAESETIDEFRYKIYPSTSDKKIYSME